MVDKEHQMTRPCIGELQQQRHDACAQGRLQLDPRPSRCFVGCRDHRMRSGFIQINSTASPYSSSGFGNAAQPFGSSSPGGGGAFSLLTTPPLGKSVTSASATSHGPVSPGSLSWGRQQTVGRCTECQRGKFDMEVSAAGNLSGLRSGQLLVSRSLDHFLRRWNTRREIRTSGGFHPCSRSCSMIWLADAIASGSMFEKSTSMFEPKPPLPSPAPSRPAAVMASRSIPASPSGSFGSTGSL